ncbi:hypothetical protein C8J55DRAFT_564924 [Lentinula edodes]|uniref:DNA helicase n=1 Tax=Lentinula lateritia TaxID=40482 RepID=A0A9W8ZW62_9AGAR|nr:hypothetical protein C8J55DRAFT_564924 [Lentinula edodes]
MYFQSTLFHPRGQQTFIYNEVLRHVDANRLGKDVKQLLILVHGSASSGKTSLLCGLFDFISDHHSPTLAFKGAATEHGAALIGGVPMEFIPHVTIMDCGQEYFFVDVGSALEMGVLTGWSEQLNKMYGCEGASSYFGHRNVVVFADIHQLAPLRNRNQVFWLHNNPITHKFLSNVHWLDTEPIHDRTSNTFLDTIRLATTGRDDVQLLNAGVVKTIYTV